jgi:glutathione peroxidase
MFNGLALFGAVSSPDADGGGIYEFTMKDIDGNQVSLQEFKGKVMLVVNVASKCGYTYQYEGLESIYKQYRDRGFVVLGFPANDFKLQEPGTDAEIKEFCRLNYGVTFPMFSKITVIGDGIDPLYEYLTSKKTNPEFSGEITWNFNKFLIGADGKILARFDRKDEPTDAKVIDAIEAALGAK